MANPFKEAEKARKKAPGNGQEMVVKEKLSVEEVVEEKKSEKIEAVGKAQEDILAGLGVEKTSGKTYAFYLSDVNVKKLKALAKKKGVSSSRLLDHILSEILCD